MGCCSSSQAAPPLVAQQAELSTVEGDFKIRATRSSDESLGIDITAHEQKFVKVTRIEESGLIAAWNSANSNTDDQLNVGDIIVAVNNYNGDWPMMRTLLSEKTELVLSVKRGVPKEAVAEISAEEHTAAIAQEPAAEPQGNEEEAVQAAHGDETQQEIKQGESLQNETDLEMSTEANPTENLHTRSASVNANEDCIAVDMDPQTQEKHEVTCAAKLCGM